MSPKSIGFYLFPAPRRIIKTLPSGPRPSSSKTSSFRPGRAPVITLRVCRVGPDGKLYVALGQPYNVPPKTKMDEYNKWGIGGIIRMNLDGTGREVFARGIRNSVGMDFNPKDGILWFTDNQVDGMGDDIPPEELNRAPTARP